MEIPNTEEVKIGIYNNDLSILGDDSDSDGKTGNITQVHCAI